MLASRGLTPDVIYASPWRRAMQTAEIICAHLPNCPDIWQDELLREKDFGRTSARTDGDLQRDYPDEYRFKQLEGRYYFRPIGGESWADCALRVRMWLSTLARSHANQTVLAVSHGGLITVAARVLLHLSEEETVELDDRQSLPNCGLAEFVRREPHVPRQGWEMRRWGETLY